MKIKTKKIKMSQIKLNSEFQHKALSSELAKRIKNFKKILKEVELIPLKITLDNFRRDYHPEIEIRIWEIIAQAYKHYVEEYDLKATLSKKKEVFGLILSLSTGNVDYKNYKELSELDIAWAESYYQNEWDLMKHPK